MYCRLHGAPRLQTTRTSHAYPVASLWRLACVLTRLVDGAVPQVRTYFCERHNFSRLFLRRPKLGTQIKSHVRWARLCCSCVYSQVVQASA